MEGDTDILSGEKETEQTGVQGSDNRNADLSDAPEKDIIDEIDQHLDQTYVIPYGGGSHRMDSTFVISDKCGVPSSVDVGSVHKDVVLNAVSEDEAQSSTIDKNIDSDTLSKTFEVNQCDTIVEEEEEEDNIFSRTAVLRVDENDGNLSESSSVVDDPSPMRPVSDPFLNETSNTTRSGVVSPEVPEDRNKEGAPDDLDKEDNETDLSSGIAQVCITTCSFASLSGENSKDGENDPKFVHEDVNNTEPIERTESDVDPFAHMLDSTEPLRPDCDILMEVEGEDSGDDDDNNDESNKKTLDSSQTDPNNASNTNAAGEPEPESPECETITGDKILAPESILENPDVCIIEDSMSDDGKGDSNPTNGQATTGDHAYTRSPASTSKVEDVCVMYQKPGPASKKKLKVLYPKKRNERKNVTDQVLVVATPPVLKECLHCSMTTSCTLMMEVNGRKCYLCSDTCLIEHRSILKQALEKPLQRKKTNEFVRKCAECKSIITPSSKTLSWETMDFCQEDCLAKYQSKCGSVCAYCQETVHMMSMGKYCVRFGHHIKQFCRSLCLEEFKKGLKACSYCMKDISDNSGFLAAVGDVGQFKDFCSQNCLQKYDSLAHNQALVIDIQRCDVCKKLKLVQVEVVVDSLIHKLCSEVCFSAFKFANKVDPGLCDLCKKYFDKVALEEEYNIFYEDDFRTFCSKCCMNVYIISKRAIVPCGWCKVKKYNFDMIKRSFGTTTILTCSLNCLALYQVSIQAANTKVQRTCDKCGKLDFAIYHLTMSDATLRHFCSYRCVINFQTQFKNRLPSNSSTQPTPAGNPKRIAPRRKASLVAPIPCSQMPVISSVGTLAPATGVSIEPPHQNSTVPPNIVTNQPTPTVKYQVLVKPPAPKQYMNKVTQVRPNYSNKGTTCKPHRASKDVQTEETKTDPVLIPVPIPIYIPVPLAMYSIPVPTPTPFPLPVPVPIFIPTTRNSTKGILEEIKRIQDKIPNDPFEAELLMMAEMVAGDKKSGETSSDSEHYPSEPAEPPGSSSSNAGGSGGEFNPEVMEGSNTFGEDMLQIALKIASELEEPPEDLDSVVTPNTPAVTQQSASDHQTNNENKCNESDSNNELRQNKKRNHPEDDIHGASVQMGVNSSENGNANLAKRQRRNSPINTVGGTVSGSDSQLIPNNNQPSAPKPKPDASMCLKYTLGVNAWRHWVKNKNAALEKAAAASGRKVKLLKKEILQQTPEELNYSLSLFVKEVKKPDGSHYTPDTIYYLCLGIQEYLYKNGRVDNIFTDLYYENFTNCLDSVAKKFAGVHNQQQLVITRVEEEHLWESKQLGVNTPYVLLTTIMYFNTKYFNLATVEEHMQLSFSHIMKHWKKNNSTAPPGSAGMGNGSAKNQGSKNVLLRFYPPQSELEANPKKKKVYEQHENEENPYRCPVKLYEFYLSKCPDSVKTRNDLFYLKPECSCVPDSPVWYSNLPLPEGQLGKILNLIKMVKEVNAALLSP